MSLKYLHLVEVNFAPLKITLEALRNNDLVQIEVHLLNSSSETQTTATYGSPLHLATVLSNKLVIDKIIEQFCANNPGFTWICMLNSDSETPLHIASKLGRADVLESLFNLPLVNDTIRNNEGKLACDLSKNEKIIALFNEKRNNFSLIILNTIKNHVLDCNSEQIINYFNATPRALAYLRNGWFDINVRIDNTTEEGILHYCAKWDDLKLLDWALTEGADPNVRNKKGKKPFEFCPKKESKTKERLKSAISQTAVLSSTLSSTPLTGNFPPFYEGSIQKWTNYAEGYKNRYFVLENGTLSYFKSKEDYPLSCRGGISMRIANIHLPDSEDKSRFEIVGKGSVRYSLKARTPTDAKKWIWALVEAKNYLEQQEKNNAVDLHDANATDWGSVVNISDDEQDVVNSQPSGSTSKGHHNLDSKKINKLSEVDSLISILKLQLDVQKQSVEEISGILEVTNIKSASDISKTLLQSTESVIHLANQIKDLLLSKELEWSKKYDKQLESARRWEEVVRKVLVPQLLDTADVTNRKQLNEQHADSAEEEDIFYDADEVVSSGGKADFLESVFGFDTYNEDHAVPIARSISHLESSTNFPSILPSFEDIKAVSKNYPSQPRLKLPFDSTSPKPTLNVWSFLKSAIGKDLSKVTLPVFFNEPLSMLQRMCEDIEYIELLSLASMFGRETTSPMGKQLRSKLADLKTTSEVLGALDEKYASELRHLFVSAFAMSNYSSTIGRTNKPFNPMLGETFEIVNVEKNYRYVAEQCCHHPPISASFCESPDFQFWSEVNVKSKFWGKSLEIHPLGICHAQIAVKSDEGIDTEHYSWKKVTTCVNNLIVGKLWIDHYGDMVIKNWRTNSECIITFKSKSKGWFGWGKKPDSKSPEVQSDGGGEIVGVLKNNHGTSIWEINGSWDTEIIARRLEYPEDFPKWLSSPIVLWKRNKIPEESAEQFNYTEFAMTLNEMDPQLKVELPKSDSRLRPDQSAMERGQWEQANSLKESIEKAQRTKRTNIINTFSNTGVPDGPKRSVDQKKNIGEEWWVPRWFVREQEKDTNEDHWVFTNSYWKHRADNTWPDYVPDLFSTCSYNIS